MLRNTKRVLVQPKTEFARKLRKEKHIFMYTDFMFCESVTVRQYKK